MTTALIETTRSDAELARAAGRGDNAAFEALYDRHHRALLSFARHMLGRVHDAEDVVQHTFIAADKAFRDGRVPASVRAWLYTVARNRCLSLLRARRDDQALPDLSLPSGENLVEDVERRDDLRALLADLRTLPDDQRAALLLAELGELSHAEVAQVLGVRERKVKALVYQARQALLAAAGARAIPCRAIREELAEANGSARRRRHLRDHVERCDGCRAYAGAVARQRASIAALLPVVPTVALRDSVIACLGGSGAAAATSGTGAGLGVVGGSGAATGTSGTGAGLGVVGASGAAAATGGAGAGLGAKLLAVAVIGGAAAGGGTVAVTQLDPPPREPAAVRSADPPARTAPAAVPLAAPDAPASTAPGRAGSAEAPARARPGRRRRAAGSTPPRRSDRASAPAARERERGRPAAPPGLARGRDAQPARDDRGGGKPPPASKPQAPPKALGTPAKERPAPPGQARNAEAAPAVFPPGQAKDPKEPPGLVKAK